MRTFLFVCFLFVFPNFVNADTKHETKEGKYTVKFPGNEKPQVTTKKTNGVELVITVCELNEGKTAYAVIYSDLDSDSVAQVSLSKLLEGGEKSFTDNFQAKVTKSGELKMKSNGKEHLAREFYAEKGPVYLRVRITLVENRLYQLFVVGTKDVVNSTEADDFVKSFEVTK